MNSDLSSPDKTTTNDGWILTRQNARGARILVSDQRERQFFSERQLEWGEGTARVWERQVFIVVSMARRTETPGIPGTITAMIGHNHRFFFRYVLVDRSD